MIYYVLTDFLLDASGWSVVERVWFVILSEDWNYLPHTPVLWYDAEWQGLRKNSWQNESSSMAVLLGHFKLVLPGPPDEESFINLIIVQRLKVR